MTRHSEQPDLGRLPRTTRGLRILPLLLAVLGTGCTLVKTTAGAPAKGMRSLLTLGQSTTAVDPVELQEDLLRCSDNLMAGAVSAATKLQKNGLPIPRKELLGIWVALAGNVLETATGSNARCGRFTLSSTFTHSKPRGLQAIQLPILPPPAL